MKTEADQAAFPRSGAIYNNGLTKREYFAAMAMQGIISTLSNIEISTGMQKLAKGLGISTERYLAEMATEQADALIEALNTPTKQ